jgi:hypothetical protein
MKQFLISAVLLFSVILLLTMSANAATRTSTAAGGDWATGSTWVGGTAPTITDNAVIATTGAGAVTTSGGTIQCVNLTINSGATLTMYRQFTVTGTTSITGTINFGSTSGTARNMTFNGAVTLNSGAVWNETTTGAAATFSFGNSLTNNATTFTAQNTAHNFTGATMTLSGTTATVIPTATFTGNYTNSGTFTSATLLTVTGAAIRLTNNGTITASTALSGTGGVTQGATGILNIGGTSGIATLTATAVGNTVNYTGGIQTVKATTFDNLTLSGSGAKTTTGVTVNGILSLEGTATASAVPTYGAASTLQYKGSSLQTTGVEFPSTFARPVIIDNVNGVTLGGSKTVSGTLTVNSGTTLNCGTNIVSGAGTFTLSSGGSLGIGSTAGIAASGTTGNIQTTTRSFSTAANYIYNGIAAQVTGNGLPATINNLTINNSTDVSLSGSVTVGGTVTATSGRINTGANTLTRSNLAGTGIKYLLSSSNYINITSAGITGITIQEYANTTPLNLAGTYDATKAVNRYYTISGVTGTGSASVCLDYLLGEQGGSYTYTSGNVWNYTGAGPWVNQGQLLAGQFYAETGSPLSSANLAGDYSIGASDAALPVQLALFVGNFVDNNVKLEWQTISEVNNYGFNVQRFNGNSKNYENVGFVLGKGTTLEPQIYSHIDENIKGSVEYRLEQIDNNGLKNYFGPIFLNPNGAVDNSVPAVFALNQNYPNPFNPSTKISFSLANAGYTTLKVYNIVGKEVASLFSGNAEAGKQYVVNFDAKSLSSGMYFYKLQSGSNVEVNKLTLVK